MQIQGNSIPVEEIQEQKIKKKENWRRRNEKHIPDERGRPQESRGSKIDLIRSQILRIKFTPICRWNPELALKVEKSFGWLCVMVLRTNQRRKIYIYWHIYN